MGSAVISIPDRVDEEVPVAPTEMKRLRLSLSSLRGNRNMEHVVHSVKVGLALVLVSLLYLLDPLYERVGDNAMWAIMTVVVIFEFFAGAVLSKGLNRGIGTVLGGGLGCLAAAFAQDAGGGTGRAIVVGVSVFIFGAGATYSRLIPSIKKTYDYGAMIFILTFNLVVVSGLRAENVMQIARQRLLTIGMGFVVAVSISLLVFPTWAGDQLHDSTASKFKDLANTIQGCVEDLFKCVGQKENRSKTSFNDCRSVLHSKAKDESLANFAKWEPWHGRFGLSHPWNKYLKIGQVLRDLAATILSLNCCLQTANKQKTCLNLKQTIKGPAGDVGSLVVWSLRELGESILEMRRSQAVLQKLKANNSLRSQLTEAMSGIETAEELAMASFVFLLMEILDKVEALAKEVDELAQAAAFQTK